MSNPHSPYVGLDPYTEEEEAFFFGRDKERRTVAFNLMSSRLTLVYGPAGVGKSSILGAGVLHDLHELAQENLKNHNHPEFVVLVFSSWRDNPVKNLINEVIDAAGPYKPDIKLDWKPSSLCETIKALSRSTNLDFLIMLDQFEDYFLYNKSGRDSPFAKQFSAALTESTLRANFLVSIREDALSNLDVFKNKVPGLFENILRIEHLRAKDARQAIEEPIKVYNKKTGANPKYVIEKELANEVTSQIAVGEVALPGLANRVESAAGGYWPTENPPIEAPLLQLVMRRLWEKELELKSRTLRLQTLKSLGNTKSIVENHLNEEMKNLPEDEQQDASEIFYYLVTPSGWKVAHTVKDLAYYTKQSAGGLELVLERLTTARILREAPSTQQSNQVGRFEIFHEVLAPAVLGWLSRYKVNRELTEERAKLEAKSRRVIILSAFVFLVAVLLAVLGGIAWVQASRAKKAEGKAQDAEKRALVMLHNYDQLQRNLPNVQAVLQGHTAAVKKAIFSPDGRYVATISDDGTARLWNADTGEQKDEIPARPPVTDIAFNNDGSVLAVANFNLITLWEIATRSVTDLPGGHYGNVSRIAFSPTNPTLLASGDEVGMAIVWDVRERRLMQRLRGHTGRINDVEWSTQSPVLITAGKDSTARIWDAITGAAVTPIRHDGQVWSAVFSYDGKEVLTASDDWSIKLSNAQDGSQIRPLRGHSGPVFGADWAKNEYLNTRFATASGDRTVHLWDRKGKLDLSVSTFSPYAEEVHGVRFSHDGARIITWGDDRTTRIWDATGKPIPLLDATAKPGADSKPIELSPHLRSVNYAEFSYDGKFAVTASSDFTARVWNVSFSVLGVSDPTFSLEVSNESNPCPGIVKLYGTITVAAGTGTVKYRFVHNGRPTAERSLMFEKSGAKPVSGFLKFQTQARGSVYLQITYPHQLSSKKVEYHVRCAASSPEEKKESSQ